MLNPEDTTHTAAEDVPKDALVVQKDENNLEMPKVSEKKQEALADDDQEGSEPLQVSEEVKKAPRQHHQVTLSPQESEEADISPSLDVDLSFSLGHQRMPLQDVPSLVEGKIISLGGADFQVSLLLEGKRIAEADLVMVEGVPSLQITKTETVAT